MNMKTILMTVLILLALVGVLAIVMYAVNHKATVTIEKTSLLPREDIKTQDSVRFTPLTLIESDSLVLIEDQSLLGLTAGAFNPQFESLSTAEQDTLTASAQHNLELQNMTAGDLSDNSGLGNATWGTVLVVALLIIIIF